MRSVKHEFGMLFTHEGRLTPKLERPNNRGRLEQVLGNRGKSEEAGGAGRATPATDCDFDVSGSDIPHGTTLPLAVSAVNPTLHGTMSRTLVSWLVTSA